MSVSVPRAAFVLGLTLSAVAHPVGQAQGQTLADTTAATRRAVSYLTTEVPRWRQGHPCYSCHNNGDGVRALIAASQRGHLDLGQIDDAVGWLRTPDRWALNADDGGVKDLPLSRIQFGAALRALTLRGGVDQSALDRTAALVIADQRPDGSWPISATSNVGTPSGYGTPLATALASHVVRGASTDGARASVARADNWFRTFKPQAVLEASAVLLGLEAAPDAAAAAARRDSLAILKQGQGRDGGWGPYTTAPSESFDTAVAVLALLIVRDNPSLAAPIFSHVEWRAVITRGRAYLLGMQNDDGSWPETTRPSGQESYSQRISTTAWALLALLGE